MTTAEVMARNIKSRDINTMPELRNLLKAIQNEFKKQNTERNTK